jgi:PEP-CTERM motif
VILRQFAFGVSFLVLAQTASVIAVPTVATGGTFQLGTGSVFNLTTVTAPGVSLSNGGVAGPTSTSVSAAASSDINYTTRARSNVTGSGIAGSNAQWFETITNSTSTTRRYSFTFRIDGGLAIVDASGLLESGNGTSGFESLISLSRGGIAADIFAVNRQVGLTTTNGITTFSESAFNNYSAVTSGSLLDNQIIASNNRTLRDWNTSFFTIDLGELAPDQSFTLSYLLRSFSNSLVLNSIDCSSSGGSNRLESNNLSAPNCIASNTRVGDPGLFLSTADPRIGFSSIATTTGVPEPATLAILGFGLAGLGIARRRAKAA